MQTKMIRAKHNKKRNTAFLYEALMKEIASCILKKDEMKKAIIVSIFKEHFHRESLLKKELDLYNGILDTHELPKHMAEKIIVESKKQYLSFDQDRLFVEQTKLINKINTRLTPRSFFKLCCQL